MPPGERKSGMPDSVEMPAPVKTTTRRAARSIAASSSAPSSGAGCVSLTMTQA